MLEYKHMSFKSKQTGAVSLVTVLFMTIILSILMIGFLKQTTVEQRAVTDDDLSARAYYAAEAGLEDGRVALKLAVSEYFDEVKTTGYSGDFNDWIAANMDPDDCDKSSTPNFNNPVISEPYVDVDGSRDNLDIEYTCLLLQPRDDFTAQLTDGGTRIAVLPEAADTIHIKWHKIGTDGPDPKDVGLSGNKGVNWWRNEEWNNRQWPAVIRATIIWWDGANLDSKTAFYYPTRSGWAGTITSLDASGFETAWPAVCAVGTKNVGDFACTSSVTLDGPAATSPLVAVALKPIYRDTSFAGIEAFDVSGGGGPSGVKVPMEGQIDVEVNGRASDVFRRIRATVDLNAELFLEESGIDEESWITVIQENVVPFALVSGESLCKTFTVDGSPDNKQDSFYDGTSIREGNCPAP